MKSVVVINLSTEEEEGRWPNAKIVIEYGMLYVKDRGDDEILYSASQGQVKAKVVYEPAQ